MKVSAFSKIDMSSLEFDLGLFNESGAIAYEGAGTVTNGSNLYVEGYIKQQVAAKRVRLGICQVRRFVFGRGCSAPAL